MPEGDTVFQAARRLDRALSGSVLTLSDFRVPSLATRDVSGATVLATVPRGKHLMTRLDNGLTVHTHLKMEGRWDLHLPGARWRRPAFTARVVLRTEEQEAVGFQVLVDLLPTSAENTLVGHLGPDLLGADWDPDEAVRRLAADLDRPLGEALLDQRNLAGIGNVFKAELCYLVGVDPRAPVSAVPDLDRLVARAQALLEANRDRSTRITTGDRRPGRQLWVYGRRGPCLRCGTWVSKADVGPAGEERPTYWCPRCQPSV